VQRKFATLKLFKIAFFGIQSDTELCSSSGGDAIVSRIRGPGKLRPEHQDHGGHLQAQVGNQCKLPIFYNLIG